MIRKIKVQELTLGMYIQDLNCEWMGHAFLRNRFMLRQEEDLAQIREAGIRELYIDTLKGIDAPDAPSVTEVQADIHEGILRSMRNLAPLPGRTSHWKELPFARQIQEEANGLVSTMLEDVRLGRQVETERLEPIVGRIADSVLRNSGTLLSLCRLKEGDTYTFQHSVSTSTLLVAFCRAMGMDRNQMVEAGIGGMLHDLGKMKIPHHILNKPGKLTDAEFERMKDHVKHGVRILQDTPGIKGKYIQIASEHHERFDGSGYPDGLHGFQVSELGRMAAIVDVYDAITSVRPYHSGMEPGMALQKLYEWSEHHFDAQLVQRFIHCIGIYPVGSLVRLESGRLAVVLELGEEGLLTPIVRLVYDTRTRRNHPARDLDLARNTEDPIVGHEDPAAWGINTWQHLSLEPAPRGR